MPGRLATLAIAALSGTLFGFGLTIAQMTDPQKIINFLDIAAIPQGNWDPSLAFVMGGGLAVAMVANAVGHRRGRPLLTPAFVQTDGLDIDRNLVVGAGLFGVGWGLSGFCPGPAIANLGIVPADIGLFVGVMFLASWITGAIVERRAGGAQPATG